MLTVNSQIGTHDSGNKTSMSTDPSGIGSHDSEDATFILYVENRDGNYITHVAFVLEHDSFERHTFIWWQNATVEHSKELL